MQVLRVYSLELKTIHAIVSSWLWGNWNMWYLYVCPISYLGPTQQRKFRVSGDIVLDSFLRMCAWRPRTHLGSLLHPLSNFFFVFWGFLSQECPSVFHRILLINRYFFHKLDLNELLCTHWWLWSTLRKKIYFCCFLDSLPFPMTLAHDTHPDVM